MPNASGRRQILGIIVSLLANGCQLNQESATSAASWLTAAGQNAQVFIEDFARQVLAAFLF